LQVPAEAKGVLGDEGREQVLYTRNPGSHSCMLRWIYEAALVERKSMWIGYRGKTDLA